MNRTIHEITVGLGVVLLLGFGQSRADVMTREQVIAEAEELAGVPNWEC